MDNENLTKASKFLSFVLRHQPEAINLSLDKNGWAFIDELITNAKKNASNPSINYELILEVVKQSDKQRFTISDDGRRIRANQGHSINVDLELKEMKPPNILYHGTASRFLSSIFTEGLNSGSRQHVHLSSDMTTPKAVGERYGKPVILKIDALAMYEQGYSFYLSKNGVWLTHCVPLPFISQN